MRLIPLASTAPWVTMPGPSVASSAGRIQRAGWRVLVWFVIAAIGAIHAWGARYEMNPDGISYLDLAHALARGEWSVAVNRLWSPLYPALLAAVLRVLQPAPFDEFPAAHLMNFVIFLGALASFEFLLSQLIGYRRALAAPASSVGRVILSEWSLRVLGYALFASSSLGLVSMSAVSPDMCVSVFVYLAGGLLLRIRQRPEGTVSLVLLGVVLGLGYLAKAAMFPLAFVFLAFAAAPGDSPFSLRLIVRRLLAALVPFALVASLLVLAFFLTGQGVTLGDSGKLNYAWHVNGLPYVHWQGEFSGIGKPAHPTREILSSPPVYEFSAPIGGTYPPWDDPAYWYEGVTAHFDVGGHVRTLVRSARVLASMLVRLQISLVIGGLLLFYLGRQRPVFLREVRPYSMLLMPLPVAIGMFSVIWLEPRFIAPLVTPFWLGVFAPMTFPRSHSVERVVKRVTGVMLALLILVTSYVSYAMAGGLLPRQDVKGQFAVAQGLRQLGVHPRNKVAVISDWPGGSNAYWALLSQVRIVAEMPACRTVGGSVCVAGPPDGVSAFLRADPGLRTQILKVFENAGADAVVMRHTDHTTLQGWRRIPDSDYSVYLLNSAAPAADLGRRDGDQERSEP